MLECCSPLEVEWGALKGPSNAAKKDDAEFDAPDEKKIDGFVPEFSQRQQDRSSMIGSKQGRPAIPIANCSTITYRFDKGTAGVPYGDDQVLQEKGVPMQAQLFNDVKSMVLQKQSQNYILVCAFRGVEKMNV